ncbi:bacterial transferase hexapeptide (three repeats) repeat protein [Neisseria lactamica ATCC 23970]|uniref:Bacterial transferase hexapeptide (Three repeats) repeat protein n=1 Tax=Neisseria lactamica ATCC 23970 TaxID=546265 RepID=D0WAJ1_NEILA|nr:bacterial transferase hexapeptide (three repeats) repeat protein [Neisseria lactamica ATCC 23970]
MFNKSFNNIYLTEEGKMNAIRTFQNRTPEIHETCMIDEACVVIGEVSLAEDVSVWPCAVLRGDVNSITVGARSNIQDGLAYFAPNRVNLNLTQERRRTSCSTKHASTR